MTTDTIKLINRTRLESWSETLTAQHATPCVMIGIGHDHNAGDLHVLAPSDLPVELAITWMRDAIAELEREHVT